MEIMFNQEAFKHVQYMFPEVQAAVLQNLLEALLLPAYQPFQAHLSMYWSSKICLEGAAAPCSIWELVHTVSEISTYIQNSNNPKNMQLAFEAKTVARSHDMQVQCGFQLGVMLIDMHFRQRTCISGSFSI